MKVYHPSRLLSPFIPRSSAAIIVVTVEAVILVGIQGSGKTTFYREPRRTDRADYIAAAKAAGFRVIGYFFETALADALRRNLQRAGRSAVPVPGVIATRKRLERPDRAEGFDELHTFTIGEDSRFVVSE